MNAQTLAERLETLVGLSETRNEIRPGSLGELLQSTLLAMTYVMPGKFQNGKNELSGRNLPKAFTFTPETNNVSEYSSDSLQKVLNVDTLNGILILFDKVNRFDTEFGKIVAWLKWALNPAKTTTVQRQATRKELSFSELAAFVRSLYRYAANERVDRITCAVLGLEDHEVTSAELMQAYESLTIILDKNRSAHTRGTVRRFGYGIGADGDPYDDVQYTSVFDDVYSARNNLLHDPRWRRS